MKEVKLCFSSGKKKPLVENVKNRINRWIRDILTRYETDKITEIVIHWNKQTNSIYQITLVDHGQGKLLDEFNSNLEAEELIKDLEKKNRDLTGHLRGCQMTLARYKKKVAAVKDNEKD